MTDVAPYIRPDALKDALDALATGSWRIAAGCTDLLPATEYKALQGPVLDITAIKALRGISQTDAGLRIGATTTWTDVILADLPPACAGLKLAAREVGAMQIQNRGTIAGNLCNASPAADGMPPLLTLEAEVEIQSATTTRQVPLRDFVTAPRKTTLRTHEMVTALLIPKPALAGRGHFLKLGARAYLVISITMTAARLVIRDGVVTDAALSVGSCGPVATRLPEVEAAMIGKPVNVEAITDTMIAAAINPIADMRADAAYRASSAAEMLRRTVQAVVSGQMELS